MSYVLEALRRADAERQHGQANVLLMAEPGAPQALPAQGAPARPRGWRNRPMLLGLLLAFLVLLFLAALLSRAWIGPSDLLPPGSTNNNPVDPKPATFTGTDAVRSMPRDANASAARLPEAPTAPTDRQVTSATADVTLPKGPILAPLPKPPSPTLTSTTPTPTASVPATPRPPLRVSGVTYSENPAHRMLIVNGRVVQEGQEVEPGHTLESIGPRSAVIQNGATRYNVNY